MTVLALIRPDSWNWALLLHVGGAMILVGGLLTAGAASMLMKRDATGTLAVFSYRILLMVGLPGLILMRAGAAWIYDKEGWTGDNDPAWLGIGFLTADLGGFLFIIALITGGIGLRRFRRGEGGEGLLRTSGIIALVLLAAYVITIWAMGGKPD
jgi:hypothetical protein